MPRQHVVFVCSSCGGEASKWSGQCLACGEWNTLTEHRPPGDGPARGYAGQQQPVQPLSAVEPEEGERLATGSLELDRVLGGGVVPGSVILLGGDPGVGKSTLLLQVASRLGKNFPVLYVSGEESPRQIAMRARRLKLPAQGVSLLAETRVEDVLATAEAFSPQVMVIDSIQTMEVGSIQSAPGSVAQVRESAAQLTRFAKQRGVAVFLVGHVTKSGELAGPRVLEHIIDVVCYLEGGLDSRYRMLRAVKNRYGAVGELGVFAMLEQGMRDVTNPSAIFLARGKEPMPGSAVTVLWEGSRPLMVEVQALTDKSWGELPRRVAVGMDLNRLAMLLAVLHRHGKQAVAGMDVFVNVVGGVRISETSGDLAVALAVASSLANRPLPRDLIAFGEVGLAGELRPVANGEARLQEAAKHGFKRALAPKANAPRAPLPGMEVVAPATLYEALQEML